MLPGRSSRHARCPIRNPAPRRVSASFGCSPRGRTGCPRDALEAAHASLRYIRSVEVRSGFLGSLAVAHVKAGDDTGGASTFEEAMAVAEEADAGLQKATAYARIADAVADRSLALPE